ncbi:hypothetical protein A9Q88_00225 [Gammaproteobacteria bacterium 50_400_T64]|nr:hypothetical protein A9Q88_00225 [Gammaproteobacteria bacterium 50_400_T64]
MTQQSNALFDPLFKIKDSILSKDQKEWIWFFYCQEDGLMGVSDSGPVKQAHYRKHCLSILLR